MRCETTSSVKECAPRARSTHGVHHAIVEVNIVIGVVLGEVLVAPVVPLVVDAVIGLALSLIAHVVIVVFVVAILHGIFQTTSWHVDEPSPAEDKDDQEKARMKRMCENVRQRERETTVQPKSGSGSTTNQTSPKLRQNSTTHDTQSLIRPSPCQKALSSVVLFVHPSMLSSRHP